MIFRILASLRQQPLPVRRRIVLLTTVVVMIGVTVVWFGFFLTNLIDGSQGSESSNPAAGSLAPPYQQ